MFKKIFLEKEIQDHLMTLQILSKVQGEITLIDRFEDVFGVVKKPYLQKKRQS